MTPLSVKRFLVTFVLWTGLLILYVLIQRYLEHLGLFELALAKIQGSGVGFIIAPAYWIIVVFALMTPLSSGTLLVILGLPIFGPQLTFLLAFSAGLVASLLSYILGRHFITVSNTKMHQRIIEAEQFLRSRPKQLWILAFIVKAIPNPLYDIWGYAFGIVRANLFTYLSASAAGGAIPLALICWLFY